MKQLSLNEWGMHVAEAVATRSSCFRGAVGCVLMDRKGKIKATGYNSPPSGKAHCIEHPCLGANKASYPDSCISVHAEISALMQCADVMEVGIVIVTLSPCFRCTKALLNSGMYRLVYRGELLPECEDLLSGIGLVQLI